MSTKQLWLLAGGNGSGKTTFYRTQLEPLGIPFINADNIAKKLYPESPEAHSYEAAAIAEELRYDLLHQGQTFCFETVFSHPSKIDFIAKAKALGYEVILVFIHLSCSELNKARITQRVLEGGHFVPDDKVVSRIPRTINNIKTAITLSDQAHLLDNSSVDKPFQRVATIKDNVLVSDASSLTDWAQELLG